MVNHTQSSPRFFHTKHLQQNYLSQNQAPTIPYYYGASGGGGGNDLPPLQTAIRNEEGYGRNSAVYRYSHRAAGDLPVLQVNTKAGHKSKFKASLGSAGGAAAATLEPPVSSSKGSVIDKYAKDKKSHSSSGHHGSSGHHSSSKGKGKEKDHGYY
ncbi:hypothetical protein PG994_002579 [Apiospora phragmitis]|uniref:Uncharacterized protein n=1 Tax=Apiospora phragmitis TaxID=2905665 RepID=A0ABR1W6T0_9PEZI